ncbi:MAG: hypothetical protein ACKN9T_08235 [Candidatus Methylumidiphilus sp.]
MKLLHLALAASVASLSFGVYWSAAEHRAPPPQADRAASAGRLAPRQADAGRVNAPVAVQSAKPAVESGMAALRREMAILRAEVGALRQQVATAGGGPVDGALAKDTRHDPIAQAEAERQRQEQMAAVEANFRGEAADRSWSERTTATVQHALAGQVAIQSSLRSVECRSSTCRVELSGGNAAALDKSLPLFANRLTESLPSVTVNQVEDGAGGVTTVLYLSSEVDQPPVDGG